MKAFFQSIGKTLIAGVLFLVPIIAVLIIVQKAWNMLTGIGKKAADLFGIQSIGGLGAAFIATSFILLLLFYISGLMVRLAFIGRFRDRLEDKILKFIPGYAQVKRDVLDKIDKPPELPKTPVLVKMSGHLQPALLVEKDENGDCIIYVPSLPDQETGQVFVVKSNDLIELETSERALNSSLKNMGKGLLWLRRK